VVLTVPDELTALETWAAPAAFVAVGLLAGILVQRLVVVWLRRAASRTAWKGDDVLVDALGRMPFAWCATAGVYAAVHALPLSDARAALADKVFVSAAILSATLVVSRALAGLVRLRAERTDGNFAAATALVTTIVRLLVIVTGLLVLFQTLGIQIAPILTTLGIGGLAVALALQDTLANLFAGLYVVLSGRTRKGDYIRLATGEEGYVTEITWRDTSVLSLPNNLIVIPNKSLASAIVTNYDQPDPETAVLVQVSVAYVSDLTLVERTTVEVARAVLTEVPGGVPTFEPFIRYHTFGDSGVGFTVILRAKRLVDQHLLKHEFVKRLHRRFAEAGITIPYPTRTVEIVGGSVGRA
jgi:small-conductance mechanosensitive channel